LAKFAIRDNITSDANSKCSMPTRNISLTAEHDEFIAEVVEAGEYQNASEAVRDALRALQQRRREDALKLEVLRAQIQAGVEALERGDFVEIEGADLEGYLERLTEAKER
jgi:antitoxin ParD1/3/4